MSGANAQVGEGEHRLAGACGNRTHPTRRSQVTAVLKTTEATRPHSPPENPRPEKRQIRWLLLLPEGNKMFPPIDHFTDHDAAVDQGKVLDHACGRGRDEESTGRLGVDEEGALEVGRLTPVD